MADSEGRNYYWESLDQNTTGENVGVVLDSLCDIVAENEAEEDQNVVKWIPGEEGQKGHFELGEGGKTEIPGNDNQIVVADGEGSAKVNTGVYTFGDSKHPEDQVSFTLDELKYLKRFIGALPSRIANDDSEATEPNTLYFIPGGDETNAD